MPAAPITPAVSVTPTTVQQTFYVAGDIADSAGVNATLFPYPTMQPSDATRLGALVGAAHIRHYRVGFQANNAMYEKNLNAFDASSQAKPLLETDCNPKVGLYGLTAPAELKAFNAAIGDAADGVEGVNEPDTRLAQDADFSADLNACQAVLSSVLDIPYVAPAIAQAGHYQAVGFIPNMAVANIHRYLAGHNPGTAGYGPSQNCGSEYASLGYLKCYAAGEAGANKPFYVTETGWNTDDGEVDLATQAKYDVRTILYDFMNGISRTYFMPLVAYTGGDGFGGDSLLRADRSPKPAFVAIGSLLNALADDKRPAGFAPTRHSLPITAGSASILALPMQKCDGSTIVALWNETMSYDSANRVPIAVPVQNVTMSIPTGQAVTTVRTIGDSGTFAATSFSVNGNKIVLPVDDHVTLVTFTAASRLPI